MSRSIVGPGGGLVGPGGGLVGPASGPSGPSGTFAISHGHSTSASGSIGFRGSFWVSHEHGIVAAGVPTFRPEKSGTFIVEVIHRILFSASATVPVPPAETSRVTGSGSMIYAIPEEASQIALEAHFLAEGVGPDRFGGYFGPLAFEGTADFPNTPYGGRIDIPTRGLLVPVIGTTRKGEFCTGVQALAPGHVVIGLQAGSLGVAFDYVFVRTTVRIDGELVWSADHETSGGLRIWGTNVDIGTVDQYELIFTGDLMASGFTSPIEADVAAGAIITAGLEWGAGYVPAFLSVDPMAMGGPNLGHLWVAGTLGGEPLVASGSGSV